MTSAVSEAGAVGGQATGGRSEVLEGRSEVEARSVGLLGGRAWRRQRQTRVEPAREKLRWKSGWR